MKAGDRIYVQGEEGSTYGVALAVCAIDDEEAKGAVALIQLEARLLICEISRVAIIGYESARQADYFSSSATHSRKRQ